ncbi:MAG: dethiobiotin synthase, partial [Chitinophagaceae bacterium]
MRPAYFISGIGTGVGKTIISAILTEAMDADYWKPVQAGIEEGTDAGLVGELIKNPVNRIHQEVYKLNMPASPHIAAREQGINISLEKIKTAYEKICRFSDSPLIIEGAGGLLVPLNETKTNLDLITFLNVPVIIVSRNYLGSINHSLLTAQILKQAGAKIIGWIFNDQFMQYEKEIAAWTQ